MHFLFDTEICEIYIALRCDWNGPKGPIPLDDDDKDMLGMR
jgi:hypothetical protein